MEVPGEFVRLPGIAPEPQRDADVRRPVGAHHRHVKMAIDPAEIDLLATDEDPRARRLRRTSVVLPEKRA